MSFRLNNKKNKTTQHSAKNTTTTTTTTAESPTHHLADTSCETSPSSSPTAKKHGSSHGCATSTPHPFTPNQNSTSPGAAYRRLERQLIKDGYLNTPMLFGYVCAMREANGLPPYSTRCSMVNALERYNIPFKEVFYAGKTYRRWYKRDTTAAALCTIRKKDHDAFLSNPATDDELTSGDWLDITATHRLTGIRKKRISKIGSDHLDITRLHPVTNDRLYHVPSVREYGYYRTTSYIRQHYGDTAADALIALRPQKKYSTGGCMKTLVYCPDLAHL